jgi:L-fucose dehydrogenase
MDLNIKDKVYIVSGGGKGIGAAICTELAKEGAIPIIAGRSKDAAIKLSKDLLHLGRKSQIITCDLDKAENCLSIIEQVIKKWGRIDGLINNAGVNDGAGLESGVIAFEESIRLNLFHYYNLAHYALPYLKKTKGSIINISSKTALTGQGGTSGYAAAKGAQLALTREWAAELLPFGIRVNAVIPSEVSTPQYENWINTFPNPEEKLSSIIKKIPLGQRMTSAEEIAAMSVFLLSDRSSHTTGQWIIPDGGYVHLDRSIT